MAEEQICRLEGHLEEPGGRIERDQEEIQNLRAEVHPAQSHRSRIIELDYNGRELARCYLGKQNLTQLLGVCFVWI